MLLINIPKIILFNFYSSIRNGDGQTEIYVPPLIYPNHEFDLQVSESLSWKISDKNPNVLIISSKTNLDEPVFVSINPKIKIHLL